MSSGASVDRATLAQWVAIERERRRRHHERVEAPKYDWYGPDCGCPADGRRSDGSCAAHPRARPNQRPPEWDWSSWLILSGRGFGKTRTGCEWVNHCAKKIGSKGRFALIGQTAADVRDVMIEGESGILACSPPWFKPLYEPSKRRITWPNGFQASAFTSEEPGMFRGPQFHGALCDEFAKWSYLEECWDNLQFGLRLGVNEGVTPQVCITTTPLPLPLVKELMRDPRTALVRGSTYDNRANLAPAFVARIEKKYEGTRLGRQEIHGEILDDNPGALWTPDSIEKHRVKADQVPDLIRLIVAVDPSVGDPSKADRRNDDNIAEAGIIVGGMGENEHFYITEDRTVKGHPLVWGNTAIEAYNRLMADYVVAEINNGGKLIETLLRTIDSSVNYKEVSASRGKAIRAEPIAGLYAQGKVHHVGVHEKLEDELLNWVPGTGMKSPNRLDALVWCVSELSLGGVPIRVGGNPFPGFRG